MVEVEVSLDHITDDLKFWVTWEGNFPREHDVEHHTKRPYIDLEVILLEENLWCDVVRLKTSFKWVSSEF